MASPIQAIIESQLLTGSAALLYTSQNAYTQIVKLTLVNTDTVTRTATVYLVPAGGSAGLANVSTDAQSILADGTFNSPNEYAHVLNPGDSIWAFADTGGKVSIRASGLLAT